MRCMRWRVKIVFRHVCYSMANDVLSSESCVIFFRQRSVKNYLSDLRWISLKGQNSVFFYRLSRNSNDVLWCFKTVFKTLRMKIRYVSYHLDFSHRKCVVDIEFCNSFNYYHKNDYFCRSTHNKNHSWIFNIF